VGKKRAFGVAAAAIGLAVVWLAMGGFFFEQHEKPLRAGYNEFSPYITVTSDGQPAGLAVDVIREAAERSGQGLVWVRVDDGEKALSDGRIDLYPLLTVTPQRVGKFHFSDYWWQNSPELVSDQRRPINRAADTAGKKIGLRMRGLIFQVANSLFPKARLVVKPDVESLVSALCAGEIDALFADARSIERHMAERPLPCQNLRPKITPVPGATMALGTVSTRMARNRADRIYARINGMAADGTLANLAATYMLATPDSNQQLVQLVQDRQRYRVLEETSLGLACLIVLLIFVGIRMRKARRAVEEARQKLDESQQRFHAFMDHAMTSAFMKDGDGRLVYVNAAYSKVFQRRPEDCLGKISSELMSEAVAKRLQAHDRMVLESGSGQQFMESVPGPEGGMHHWLSFKFPFRGRTGEVFLGGVSIDVTEMIQAQNALRESEARYRQIVEYAGDIIVRCDGRGRVTYVNQMGERVLKMPAARLCGQRALKLVGREERQRIVKVLRGELAAPAKDGALDFYVEMPVVTGDGKELWLGQTIRALRVNGVATGFQAISRDITERRAMEEELRTSEERFRRLYENGPVAYHEIDREGVVQRVNRAECEMLGIAADQLIGRCVSDLLAPEEREASRAAIAAKLSEQLALQPFQRIFLRSDGRRLRVEIHEKLLRDAAGQVIGLHSVLLDVTQRHLSELLDFDRRELSDMVVQQQPLDRILSGVSMMISHQNEDLVSIPLRLVREDEMPRMEPVSIGPQTEKLCQSLRELGHAAFALWPPDGVEVSHSSTAELAGRTGAAAFARVAEEMGFRGCWSVPMISSSRNPLGMLLVLSPQETAPTLQESQLMQGGSRIAAIASEHRLMTDLLAFQASHDCLTRLPNRSTFETRLEEAILRAGGCDEQLAVFYVDLDRFKEVNDTLGHSGGDELLRQVAVRLGKCIRHSDVLSRIGGDEFSLLVEGLHDRVEADRVAEAILRVFRTPFDIGGVKVSMTASIGISFYPEDGRDATTLQRHSDSAMYGVKNAGKNSFRCYAGTRASPVALLS
jgi:diguanylate cyclase (GGDEF)-like protein/PAS domain S-box-containing protein